ncbi:MAG: hypothetical protein JWR18_1680 [Segetibacter sp.]|nr:hypothetical protein [Segetibacter sp.]
MTYGLTIPPNFSNNISFLNAFFMRSFVLFDLRLFCFLLETLLESFLNQIISDNSSCIREISRLGANSETMRSSFGNKRVESRCKNEAQRLERLL